VNTELHALVRRRWAVAVWLSSVVVLIYFGFILLVAFNKDGMATQILPGLSWGILLGAVVIVAAWLTTWVYVAWANRHFDAAAARLAQEQRP
jgi:uncharacterized membrane protein (DUF485 family)